MFGLTLVVGVSTWLGAVSKARGVALVRVGRIWAARLPRTVATRPSGGGRSSSQATRWRRLAGLRASVTTSPASNAAMSRLALPSPVCGPRVA